MTLCSIFLVWLVTAGQGKKYLIEVADDDQAGQGVTHHPAVDLPDLEEVRDASLEEMIADEAKTESESKYLILTCWSSELVIKF